MPEWMNSLIVLLQLCISFGTICTMLYAVKKFFDKPEVTQNDRLDAHDKRFSEMDTRLNSVETRLNAGADHFKKLDETIALTQGSLIIIMDCLTELVPENSKSKDKLATKREELLGYLIDKK